MIPSEFPRGVIYTVDPRILAPLIPGEEYRIVASSRFLVPKDVAVTDFEPLYHRARGLIARRRAELTGVTPECGVHAWIVSHGWFQMDIGKSGLAGAVVTLGVRCALVKAERPDGQEEPTPEALRSPYVAQLGGAGGSDTKMWYDEFYNDFDMRTDRSQMSALNVSYGEYVPSREDIDVSAVVARAEDRARFYLDAVGAAGEPLRIARCDWNCLDTGKSAKPFLAHVDLLFSS